MRGRSSKAFRSIVGSTCIIVSSPCTRQVSFTAWATPPSPRRRDQWDEKSGEMGASVCRSSDRLLTRQHPQLLEPGFMVGRNERLEGPLRLLVKGRLPVIRQSQEGAERREIFPPPSRQVLFHIRLI